MRGWLAVTLVVVGIAAAGLVVEQQRAVVCVRSDASGATVVTHCQARPGWATWLAPAVIVAALGAGALTLRPSRGRWGWLVVLSAAIALIAGVTVVGAVSGYLAAYPDHPGPENSSPPPEAFGLIAGALLGAVLAGVVVAVAQFRPSSSAP